MTTSPGARQNGWLWTLLAAGTGFLASFVFSSVLHLSRGAFLGVWVVVAAAFLIWYQSTHRIDVLSQWRRRWAGGLVVGVVLGAVLVRQVFTQPGSAGPKGVNLVAALASFGLAYGIVDALMLTIVPVLSLYGMRPASELQDPGKRYGWAFVALLGSALVTAAYHVGFAEFRGPQLVQPLIGNALITVSYLLTGSPVAPIVSHVMMHAAAVVQGMETTMQLPPHY